MATIRISKGPFLQSLTDTVQQENERDISKEPIHFLVKNISCIWMFNKIVFKYLPTTGFTQIPNLLLFHTLPTQCRLFCHRKKVHTSIAFSHRSPFAWNALTTLLHSWLTLNGCFLHEASANSPTHRGLCLLSAPRAHIWQWVDAPDIVGHLLVCVFLISPSRLYTKEQGWFLSSFFSFLSSINTQLYWWHTMKSMQMTEESLLRTNWFTVTYAEEIVRILQSRQQDKKQQICFRNK